MTLGSLVFLILPVSDPLPQCHRWSGFNKRNSCQAWLLPPLLKEPLKSKAACENAFLVPGTSVAPVPNRMH